MLIINAIILSLLFQRMYVVQMITNFFIPSGSGQVATTMRIFTPLADLIGVLSVAKINYEKGVKFLWPLVLVWLVIGGIFLVVANMMNYGPF